MLNLCGNMSTSEVYCTLQGDKNQGIQGTSSRDGPDKISRVPKSLSLQEVGAPRSSLKDISETEDSPGSRLHSSGVFSCSGDISDVCMADFTKYSDSTLSESASKSHSVHNQRDPSISSTPLPVMRCHQLPNLSPALTPIRSHTDSLLSPQFGASDDYLRRNIIFINKQLNSLMTQLHTEDKYFQNCSEKYEEIIADLRSEIADLKRLQANNADGLLSKYPDADQKVNELLEECKEKELKISQLQRDLEQAIVQVEGYRKDNNHLDQNISQKKILDLLPSLRTLLQSANASLLNLDIAESSEDCNLDEIESIDQEDIVECFDKFSNRLIKIIGWHCEAKATLSFKLEEAMSDLKRLKTQNEESFLSTARLRSEVQSKDRDFNEIDGKMKGLVLGNNQLQWENAESQTELIRFKTKCELLEKELSAIRDQYSKTSEQMVLSSEGRLLLDKKNQEMKAEVDKLTKTLTENNKRLIECQNELERVSLAYSNFQNDVSFQKIEMESEIVGMSAEVSEARRQISDLLVETGGLKRNVSSKELEISRLQSELKELEAEHKKLVEEFRIKGSGLILENSKLKEELEKLHKSFNAAQISAERSTDKFNELQQLYVILNGKMESKESAFSELEAQKTELEKLSKENDAVLTRLYSNFNELLAIFRECQEWGLNRNSSAADIDDGFIRLKRRLLDLSQDYITLNNRNKVLEKEAIVLASSLKEKDDEAVNLKRKYENKFNSLQRTLEKIEGENKLLISQKIEQDDAMKILRGKVVELNLQPSKGCPECSLLRNQLQQLQIDLVNKESAISTLELHIQSCCEYNRKKAQQYKHDLHAMKRQMDAQVSFAGDFGMSPKKSKGALSLKVDVGTQAGESFFHHLTGGFVERFKIRDLEEKVVKLEKEKTVLKRLCKIRSDRIHELESNHERTLSSTHSSK